MNAALGPLDYRVPDGHGRSSRARSSSRRWPAPAARRGVGGGAAADRGGRRQPAASAGRPGRRAADRGAAAPPLPSGPRIIISRRWPRCCGWCCRRRPRSRAAPAHRISPDRLDPRPADAAAREGARRARRPPGHGPRARRPCRGQRRGHARAGQRRRARSGAVDADRPLPRPDPDFAPPELNDEQREAAASLSPRSARASIRCCSTGSPARARPRSISKRSPRCLRQGKQALVLLPEIALTEPFLKRFEARFGCAPVAWHSDLRSSQRRRAWRGDRQRRGEGHGRRPLGAVPALSEPRPDRRRRGARAELQAGRRRPVSRPRHGGDAGQVRGYPGDPVLGDAGDREPAHGRGRPLPRGHAARSASPARACPTSARST